MTANVRKKNVQIKLLKKGCELKVMEQSASFAAPKDAQTMLSEEE